MLNFVTIFCSSSRKTSKKYIDATLELADILIKSEIEVLYGGGAVGLMGSLADRIIEKGGKIKGIIPEFMVKIEWAHPKVKDMIIVHDMHERKKLLIHNTDAVIALPGGTGTLEELMEVLTLKRLGKFFQPVILLNTDGFYDHLIRFFEKMVEEGMLRPEHLDAYRIVRNPSEVLNAINHSPRWNEDAIMNAPV
jgi:uncharacterized protein (TIGR00730 family)